MADFSPKIIHHARVDGEEGTAVWFTRRPTYPGVALQLQLPKKAAADEDTASRKPNPPRRKGSVACDQATSETEE